MPLILTPIQIAFLEMVIDPACSVVFEAEVEEEDVMQRPPRDPLRPLLRRGAGPVGPRSGCRRARYSGRHSSAPRTWRSGAGSAGAGLHVARSHQHRLILVNRSFNASVLRAFLRPNRALWVLFGGVAAVLAVAVYWPPAQGLFKFGALHWQDLAVCAGAGLFSLLLLEGLKANWFGGAAGGRCQQRRRVACDLQSSAA